MFRFYIIIPLILSFGCASSEATLELQTQIKHAQEQIEQAKIERERYGEGSVLHSLISLRMAMHQQTLAMLEQKIVAIRWSPRFSYAVDGTPYQPPADASERVKSLQQQIDASAIELKEQRIKAASYGGLIGIMATLTSELKAFELAQLEYQHTAYKFDFPPYVGSFRDAADDTRRKIPRR